jgi:hypothetical protein
VIELSPNAVGWKSHRYAINLSGTLNGYGRLGMYMRLRLAVLALVMILSNPAMAQYGISNQRDRYGNLIRDGGTISQQGVNQTAPNNGAIRNTPIQPPTNPSISRTQPIFRSGPPN